MTVPIHRWCNALHEKCPLQAQVVEHLASRCQCCLGWGAYIFAGEGHHWGWALRGYSLVPLPVCCLVFVARDVIFRLLVPANMPAAHCLRPCLPGRGGS